MNFKFLINFKKVSVFVSSFVFFFVLLLPSNIVFAQLPKLSNLCNTNVDQNTGQFVDPCSFDHLLILANNFITFLMYLAIPLAAISFVFAGASLISSGGSEEKMRKAKSIFTKTAIGLVFVLAAWLIVHAIVNSLIDPSIKEAILLENP